MAARLPPLAGSDVVVLALIDPSALDSAVLETFSAWLTDDERKRRRAFRAPDAALHFVVGRGLMRLAFSRYAGGTPAAWRFETGAHGKPRIAAPESSRDLRFNLSHTEGLVALAVAEGFDVGVDVEDTARALDIDELGPLALAPEELTEIQRLAAPKRRARFFDLWTLKEAYSKARGLGVSLPFDSFAFDLRADRPRLRRGADDGSPDWTFHTTQITPRHALALAARSENIELRIGWTTRR